MFSSLYFINWGNWQLFLLFFLLNMDGLSLQHTSDSHRILIFNCIKIPSPFQLLRLVSCDIKMLLQSCSQYREIHSHVHSLHKNHTQKKKSTANWDQIPSPTRKQGTTTGFISHFAKKKTNPDELYSETWKPPAWKAAKPCLSSVTSCGVARPSPCILSSSEMQQFSAKTGKKNEKINLYIPSC